MSSRRTNKRLVFLGGAAAAIGLAAGGAAWLLVHLIGLLTNLALFHRWGWDLPSFRDFHVGPDTYLVAIAGGLVVALLAKWSPVIKGHGIPEAMEAVLIKQSRIAPRTAIAKPLSAAVAIGTGGPFGAEGPIIVTGGALGSLLGQLLHVTPNERKVLLASGAAAGMAATFGAPLAAVVLAIELLLFEFSTRAFVPLVIATSIAAGVHSALFGSGPLFGVAAHDFAGLGQLPLFAVLGGLCGLLAVVIAKGLFTTEAMYRRLPVGEFWHPAVGAALFVTVGIFQPRVLGVGYDVIEDAIDGRLAIGALVLIGGAKLICWWFALGSGTSGGTLAPILLISACFGSLFGELLSTAFPSLEISSSAFALVAMAATFAAATGATFASIVFVFELTRDYDAILPLMGASVLASVVAGALLEDNILTEKLSHRGHHVPSDYHADVMRSATVGEVMTRDVVTLPDSATVADAVAEFGRTHHGAYPVVDPEGRCVGMMSRGDLLLGGLDDRALLADAGARDVITVSPRDALFVALERMIEEQIDHLPVVDGDGPMIGICTRADVMSARQTQFVAERPQPGWLPRAVMR